MSCSTSRSASTAYVRAATACAFTASISDSGRTPISRGTTPSRYASRSSTLIAVTRPAPAARINAVPR